MFDAEQFERAMERVGRRAERRIWWRRWWWLVPLGLATIIKLILELPK